MMQKYGYALPLYRQESEWKRIGLAFSRANLANWIIIASKEWLAPVYGGCMRCSWKSAVSMLMKHLSRCITKRSKYEQVIYVGLCQHGFESHAENPFV